MHHTTELRHIELRLLIQQLVAIALIHVALARGVIIDLQPVYSQIQHLLYGSFGTSNYKLVYHLRRIL